MITNSRNVPVAGAKAETELVARAMAAKAPMMEEKPYMIDWCQF